MKDNILKHENHNFNKITPLELSILKMLHKDKINDCGVCSSCSSSSVFTQNKSKSYKE